LNNGRPPNAIKNRWNSSLHKRASERDPTYRHAAAPSSSLASSTGNLGSVGHSELSSEAVPEVKQGGGKKGNLSRVGRSGSSGALERVLPGLTDSRSLEAKKTVRTRKTKLQPRQTSFPMERDDGSFDRGSYSSGSSPNVELRYGSLTRLSFSKSTGVMEDDHFPSDPPFDAPFTTQSTGSLPHPPSDLPSSSDHQIMPSSSTINTTGITTSMSDTASQQGIQIELKEEPVDHDMTDSVPAFQQQTEHSSFFSVPQEEDQHRSSPSGYSVPLQQPQQQIMQQQPQEEYQPFSSTETPLFLDGYSAEPDLFQQFNFGFGMNVSGDDDIGIGSDMHLNDMNFGPNSNVF